MNAHGEADPIDGIVSIKSTAPTTATSCRATGAHTPFASSGWAAAAVVAAATAAGYMDPTSSSSGSNQNHHPHSASAFSVLPRDLNEARAPVTPIPIHAPVPKLAVSLSASPIPTELASPDIAVASTKLVPATPTSGFGGMAIDSPSVSAFAPSQLPNSAFYKPLASICSPIRRASANSSALGQQQQRYQKETLIEASQRAGVYGLNESASAPHTAVIAPAGLPSASLAEVNSALAAFASEPGDSNPTRKRKIGDADLHESLPSPATAAEENVDGTDNSGSGKRLRGEDNSSVVLPTLAMGAGAPMHEIHHARLAAIAGSDDEGGDNTNNDDDGWLLDMDQLVDTEALMVESPPPSPAASFDTDSAAELGIAEHHLAASASSPASLLRTPGRSGSRGSSDLFARWDRIPVNIFKRSRALASSNNRREMMVAHRNDDMVGTVSSLALTAIKSSRQRRALVGSTLLTQHTLPTDHRHQKGRHVGAMRKHSRALRNGHSPSLSANAFTVGLRRHASSTPSLNHVTQSADRSVGASVAASSDSDGGSTHVSSAKESAAMDASGPTDSGADETSSAKNHRIGEKLQDLNHHVRVVSGASASDSAGVSAGFEESADAADDGYAFGWLEDEEDLLLFADPDMQTSSFGRPPNMTMVLASSSPMLMPFASPAAAASRNGATSPAAPRHPH
ncbi:hypothetical protein H4217_008453 [Coemansia sp. RSA 1939]|nr:hypothetical protein H4217_008453 [Coemansia sp. RSA 1939]KAJ2690114.1 hypothetical protein GGH99_002689 [Coemansia sp. RSA 1285]